MMRDFFWDLWLRERRGYGAAV
jgi:hypothetical protein